MLLIRLYDIDRGSAIWINADKILFMKTMHTQGNLPDSYTHICFPDHFFNVAETVEGIQEGMSTSGGSAGAHRTAKIIEKMEGKLFVCNELSLRMKSPIFFMPPVEG